MRIEYKNTAGKEFSNFGHKSAYNFFIQSNSFLKYKYKI